MKKFLLALLFLGSLGGSLVAQAEMIEHIVAVVNSEIITESDLRAFSKKLEKNNLVDDLLLMGKTVDALKKSREDQLNYLINQKIIDSEIKKQGLTATREKIDQEIGEIAKRNGLTAPELLNAVKTQGMSVSDYQEFIRSKLEKQALIGAEISSKISISEDEILASYLKENPSSESTIFEYTIAHIFFNPKKNGGLTGAKARAETVLRKLDSGESFETLAEQNTEDPNFSSGGLLGTFKSVELSKEFEGAVRNLEVGQTTGIVDSKAGLHILKLLSKKVVSDPKYMAEKEKIKAALFDKAFQKAFKDWLESKKESSFLRINS